MTRTERHEAVVKKAADAVAANGDEDVGDVDVVTDAGPQIRARGDHRQRKRSKGFDLLVVGVDNVVATKDRFDRKIEDIAAHFEGPLAVVAAKGKHLKQPAPDGLNILVPVSGSSVSKRGAEVAVALAPGRIRLAPRDLCRDDAGQGRSARRFWGPEPARRAS
ncbi:hypothetical protein ACU4GH_05945 [Bradyrhizobium betae]